MAQERWQTGWTQAPGRRGEEERKEKRESADDDQVAVGDDTTVHFLAPDEFGSAAVVFFWGPALVWQAQVVAPLWVKARQPEVGWIYHHLACC